MIEVHPPHEAAHTWTDFFIHIATICVGLLIAIGLEQSVEAVHRQHERTELRRALDAESRQILHDTQNVEDGSTLDIAWFKQAKQQLSDAARDHRAPGALAPRPRPRTSWDVPDDPVYTAAKSSGKLALLDDNEVAVYGELDSLIVRINAIYAAISASRNAVSNVTGEVQFGQPPGLTLATDDNPADLYKMYDVLVNYQTAMTDFRYWSRQARGAATALLSGERDLRKVEAAERQFDKLP